MQGRVIGGICLLAFLLSKGRAEELESLKESKVFKDLEDIKQPVVLNKNSELETPGDLKNAISLAVTDSNSQDNEGRSGAISQSGARSFGGPSVSPAVVESNGDGSSSTNSDSYGGSSQSTSGGAQALPFNPFNEELGPYIPPGSSLSQAEAQAISDSGNSYGQGQNSYPYSSSYPYSPGLSVAQAPADSAYYQRGLLLTPNFNPHGPGLNSAQAQTQADNGLYQPGYNGSPNLNPNNQGSSFLRMQSQGDSESYQPIIEPISMIPKPDTKLNSVSESHSTFPSTYPYSPSSSSDSVQIQNQGNSGSYQPIPIPNPNFSSYERFLVPYEGSSSTQTRADSEEYQPVPIINPKENRYESNLRPYSMGSNSALGFASSHPYGYGLQSTQTQAENEPYQSIPIPDPNPAPYDAYLVPYRDLSISQTQTDDEAYKPILIPKLNSKQKGSISRLYSERSNSASVVSSSYGYGLQPNPTQDKIEPYQAIPISDPEPSPYGSYMVPYREPDSDKDKVRDGSDAYQTIPIPYDPKTHVPLSLSYPHSIGRSRGFDPAIDEVDLSPDLKSKSGWDPYEYNPYPPSGPNPQLYPSGAEAAQAYPDVKPAASGVSLGISPYAVDYPSESPYRPGGFNQAENQAQGPPNVFASGQSSSIAFEGAKSRIILPHEYVFPNKMPGGENAIQCTKENEFHHFWSEGLDCLVCICLNEYGLLTPVCASCGGCHNPPPKLPEPFPRLPETIPVEPVPPEPFEPMPIIPELYPTLPEPTPVQSVPGPNQPIPTPEPNPVYPEPIPSPSPVPELFPEPVPTLPPLLAAVSCNPLPSGQPFTNPLHPCQICVCRESYTSGKPDVQIDCKESPQCIAPADVTTLPPLPDVPVSIPLPLCEKFPENVLFPHPTETCKLCKCSKSFSEKGVPEQQITCYPHPDCVPKVEPITEPAPPLPLPVDPYQLKPFPEPEPVPVEPLREPYIPLEPVPLPEIVTVEPLPWPPITTIAPVPTPPALTPRPGPLPGPSPHESCRPYPPNQAFQHPWDECQLCLCTEAIAVGMITVEVNCYTKPSCCIEPPESLKAAFSGNLILFIGYNMQYPGLGNGVSSSDIQAVSSGPPSGAITSTYRPPPAYPSYSPRPVNIYPGNNPAVATDTLNQPQVYPPQTYPRMPADNGYGDPSSSYPYQPNYHPTPYVNPPYPPRLPTPANTIGPYKANNFGYPGNYQYAQGDAYPGPQGHFQPYDPRFQGVPTPNVYPPLYQRANYEIPSIYPLGQIRDGYTQPQTSAQGGPSAQNLAQNYNPGAISRSKAGNEGPEDSDDSQ